MDRTKLLKGLYTVGAMLLGGALYVNLIPMQFVGDAHGAMLYLVLHSYLPSAKTGSPQG